VRGGRSVGWSGGRSDGSFLLSGCAGANSEWFRFVKRMRRCGMGNLFFDFFEKSFF
jgi:hypothetical protein